MWDEVNEANSGEYKTLLNEKLLTQSTPVRAVYT